MKTTVSVISVSDGIVGYAPVRGSFSLPFGETCKTMPLEQFKEALAREYGLQLEHTAAVWALEFNTSDQLWANTSALVAANYIANEAIKGDLVESVHFDDPAKPLPHYTIDFRDGSLIVFKHGSWVAKGFYCQTQNSRA